MTESNAPSDPGTRGDLTIADRVVDKIAARAAVDVRGVVPSGSGLDKVVGRRLPRVSTNTQGTQTRIRVDISTVWPRSAAQVCGEVRSAVTEAVSELAGLRVVAVDVSVARIETTRPARRRPE